MALVVSMVELSLMAVGLILPTKSVIWGPVEAAAEEVQSSQEEVAEGEVQGYQEGEEVAAAVECPWKVLRRSKAEEGWVVEEVVGVDCQSSYLLSPWNLCRTVQRVGAVAVEVEVVSSVGSRLLRPKQSQLLLEVAEEVEGEEVQVVGCLMQKCSGYP